MDIRITGSAVCAIGEMHNILRGQKEAAGCPRPIWCNFTFFGRITGSPIKRVERKEPTEGSTGGWVLSRAVEFYYNNKKVAIVEVQGFKSDKTGDKKVDGKLTFWGVKCIRYAKEVFTSSEVSVPPENEWIEYVPETFDLSCRIY